MALLGYTKATGRKNGGVLTLGLVEKSNIEEVTYSVDKTSCTGITLRTGSFFTKYEFKEDEAEYKEELSFGSGSAVVSHELKFYLEKMSGETMSAVTELMQASGDGLVAIIQTYNLTKFVVGYSPELKGERPLRLSSVIATTGRRLKDATGEVVTLQSEDVTKACTFADDLDGLFGQD